MQEKPILKPIQKLYRKNGIDLMLFAFVFGVREYLTGASIADVVDQFLIKFDLDEKDYPLESAITTYSRMLKDFNEINKDYVKI